MDSYKDQIKTQEDIKYQMVYTHGSCTNRSEMITRSGGAAYIIGGPVMYGRNKGIQTERRGELYAVTLVLRYTKGPLKIMLNLENSRREIMKEVRIKRDTDLLMKIWKLMKNRKVIFKHVRGREFDWKNDLVGIYAKQTIYLYDFKIKLRRNLNYNFFQ